jgi:hypothetical protein
MALPSGMTSCAMCVEYTTHGTDWDDVSDEMSVVEPPTATRMSGEAYVFGEDTAVTGVGKREPVEVTIRGVFQEGTTTAHGFYQAYTEFVTTCGGLFAVRWAPGGCTTDNEVFSTQTADSEIVSLTYPAGDAGSGDIIMYEAVVRTSAVTRATWS